MVAGLVAVGLGGGSAAAGVGSAHEQGVVAASRALDEFAGLVELPSGREVYLECRGEGSPTVILESGGGLAASQWSVLAPGSTLTAVFPAVSQFTRVCAYDRPGTVQVPDGSASRSDPVPLPRSFADMIIELRELLEAADVPGPYVLAAHSMGGAVARLFAGQYPGDVVGFVSLDAATATIYESFVELVGPSCCDLPGAEFRVQEAIAELHAAEPLRRMPMVVLEHSRDRQRSPTRSAGQLTGRSRSCWTSGTRRSTRSRRSCRAQCSRWPRTASTTSCSTNQCSSRTRSERSWRPFATARPRSRLETWQTRAWFSGH